MELWLLEEKLWLGFFDRQSAAMADLLVAEVAGVRSRVLVLGFWASAFIFMLCFICAAVSIEPLGLGLLSVSMLCFINLLMNEYFT